ncbi:Piwi domain-containing protein [Rhodocollybia butyracea]|uniref:Piwi domain-containing protein n=1 Tax=Rhodocollybia butyracea TaxID=206335 RepID=A0A9P5Q134_9AGAR|nr:Piwi domain-containing protein [Rhodocollybia butyracea]
MSYRGRAQDGGWRGRGRGGGERGGPPRGGERGGPPRGRGGGGRGTTLNRNHRLPVVVNTNSFEITKLPSKEYYLYSDIDSRFLQSPEVKKFEGRQQILDKLQIIVAPEIFNPRVLYDGKHLLYSSQLLNLEDSNSGMFEVNIFDRPPRTSTDGRPPRGLYRVAIKLTSSEPIRPSDLDTILNGGAPTPQSITATNLLQLLIRQSPNQNHPHNSRAYFSDVQKSVLGDGIELWRGFFQSVRPNVGKMLINIDTTMAAMYKSGPLIEVAKEFLGCGDAARLDLQAHTPDYRRLEQFLNNLKLMVNTPASKDRTKSIRGLIPNAGNFAFAKDGQDMTVATYMKITYNIDIRYKAIVGVRLSPKNADNPTVVPLEICMVLPGQFYKHKIPDRHTKAVVEFSTLKPEQRLDAIMGRSGGRMLPSPIKGYIDSSAMIQAKMEVSQQPVRIRGELLALPQVLFGNNSSAELRNGSWNVARQRFIRPAALICWGVINFSRSIDQNNLRRLMGDMTDCCKGLGMDIAPPAFFENGPEHASDKILGQALEALKRAYNNISPEDRQRLANAKAPSIRPIVVVILPKLAQELRRKIKHCPWNNLGVLTQCLQDDKIKSAKIQYWGNVAVKLNARLGGYNSIVNSPAMSRLQQKNTIVMGADVAHPGPGSLKPSVASLVASYDDLASRYVAFTRIQHPRQEFIQDLKEMVTDAINNYVGTHNGNGVARIVFFRDGISEGEFESVSRHEIAAIKSGVAEVLRQKGVSETYMPQLTYVIVGKRHHVTFYPELGTDANDGRGNCIAGFVNDSSDFSNPSTEDFYLQSHGAIQGTSRSAHYIVIQDEVYGNNLEEIQDLAFTLCHVYAKATRSVSIPAPVYYADLVCARGAIHFSDDSELKLASETASNSSGPQTFDLDIWQGAFKPTNNRAAREMYFL